MQSRYVKQGGNSSAFATPKSNDHLHDTYPWIDGQFSVAAARQNFSGKIEPHNATDGNDWTGWRL